MAKFSVNRQPNVTSPIRTTGQIGTTHEGATGYGRDSKSQLFLLAISNFSKEKSFYENAQTRDQRYVDLIHQVTREDPEWVRAFIPWLRNTANMRSAPLVMACEYVRAGGKGGRSVIQSAISRADEVTEVLGYWSSQYGKNFPQPIKRGISDAINHFYTQRNAIKYDSSRHAWRMGDAIELTHPCPKNSVQSHLFRYLIDVRHNRENITIPEDLEMIRAYRNLYEIPVSERRELLESGRLNLEEAGMTWESLSGWIQGEMSANVWEKQIPQMGYMAQLRNLKNFEQKEVSERFLQEVASYLSNPENVAKSRQFPIRFYSAFRYSGTTFFAHALEKALDASLQNVPVLNGRVLILVDLSGSMWDSISEKSEIQRWEIAAVFGTALARKNDADLYGYSSGGGWTSNSRWTKIHPLSSSLRTVTETFATCPSARGGTETFQTLQETYNGHDAVVILSDEQCHPHQFDVINGLSCPVYTFNLGGYEKSHMPTGEKGRYCFGGGLTDQAFTVLDILHNQRRNAEWPFLQERLVTAGE